MSAHSIRPKTSTLHQSTAQPVSHSEAQPTARRSEDHVHFSTPPRPQRTTPYAIRSNRVVTDALAEPQAWSATEKWAYAANSVVWWTRRISGDNSRRRDAKNVAGFLTTHGLWNNGQPVARLSLAVLRRLDIERDFWWISETQVQGLADMISAFAARNPPGSGEEFEELVYAALFGRTGVSL